MIAVLGKTCGAEELDLPNCARISLSITYFKLENADELVRAKSEQKTKLWDNAEVIDLCHELLAI